MGRETRNKGRWQKHAFFTTWGIWYIPPFNIILPPSILLRSRWEISYRFSFEKKKEEKRKTFQERNLTFYDIVGETHEKYLKVATRLTDGGHPMTKEVSRDLPAEPSATSSIPVDSHSSEMRTLSFSLKWPPERALAMSSKSLKRNKCRSRLCNPCLRKMITVNTNVVKIHSKWGGKTYVDELNGCFHDKLPLFPVVGTFDGRRQRSRRIGRRRGNYSRAVGDHFAAAARTGAGRCDAHRRIGGGA